MAAEHIPVQVACRVLDVSTSGFYAFRSRPPSQRAIRHAWLTDLIVEVHQRSRGTYGALRGHAELRLGHGVLIGHNAVALLMRRAGLAGATGSPSGAMPSLTTLPPTWSTATSPAAAPTSCGSPISPSTPRARASSTARWSWTASPAGWSAGRSTPPRRRPW